MSFLRGSRSTRLPSGRVLQLSAIFSLIAIIAGLAINSNGFDVKNVNLTNHNIWILQKVDPKKKNQDDGRYARVNTQVNELGLKNVVKKPTELLQSSVGSLLFNKDPSYINIASAAPVDFTPDTDGAISLSSASISSDIGSSVAAIIDSSRVLKISTFDGTVFPAPLEAKLPKGVSKTYGFDAVAVAPNGSVFTFSSTDGAIREFNPAKQEWTNFQEQISGTGAGTYQLAEVGDHWALLNVDASKLWVQGGSESVSVAAGSNLQKSGNGSIVYLSSNSGLETYDAGSRKLALAQEVAGALETSRPIEFGGKVFAAWLAADKGWFFDSGVGGLQDLPFDGKTLDPQQLQKPTTDLNLVTNGESAVVNETYSGWAWSLPSGALISGSQNWDGDPPPVKNCDTDCPPPDQMPPRPTDDNFGVRAGQLISLPVLINDSDTNAGDIITIDPESVKGLDPAFGEVRTSSNQQMLVVAVKDNATGTASFRYQITDGVSPKPSKSAKVTLHVVSDSKNSAPGWCTDVVSTCIQQWPEVKVEPGSEVTVPFLDAWVDPEGDRFFIASATIVSGEGNLAFSAAGDLVYQNENLGSKKSSDVEVKVVVSDVRGAKVSKSLVIHVAPKSGSSLSVPVLVSETAAPLVVDFADYITGSAGQVSIAVLVANEANKNSGLSIEQIDDTKAKLTSDKVGPAILDLTLNDTNGSKLSTTVRVNFVDASAAVLATSPVTALVSPGLDSSIDLFTAAHNPANRALVISDISTSPTTGATISADKIKDGFVRVRGRTAQDSAGFVGVVNYKISDGSGDANYRAIGQIFVYEMPDPDSNPPVARQDTVVVRAGETASVDVLANDLGNPGVPLVIDSKSLKQDPKDSCIKGGLVFAGGGKIRVVAPMQAGLYMCSYSIYPVSNPLVKSVATLAIRVKPADDSNQAPEPQNLYARVRAGETVNIAVPVVGVDPDGDQVSVRSISGIKGDKGAAYINPDGASLEYSAVASASGQDVFSYSLVDSKGMVSATALVKVAIISTEPDTAPATMNDYAEVLVGDANKVVLDPISNDYDPQPDAKNPISLVEGSVKPDVPVTSKYFDQWSKQVVSVQGNRITVAAGNEPTTMRFVYRAKSSSGSESVGYITVKVTKDAIDDAPDVTDTYVTQAQQRDLLTTSGIDVVSDKILWTSGDVNKLTLSVWGGLDGFKVLSNSALTSATIPENAGLVIFKLSGVNFYGKQVESYGFMHLPGLTPKITFDPAASVVKVPEDGSATFDIGTAVNLPGQITVGKVSAHGLRSNAHCQIKSGTSIEYSAGGGAPWSDFCDVQIKVTDSSEPFTTIMVPIKVLPTNPEPILLGRQLTVVPGDENAQTTELKTMTTWEGKTEADKDSLQYSLEGGNDLFKIVKSGSSVTVSAYGSAPVGSIRKVKVSISNHPKTAPVYLVLIVGQLPNNLPVGATMTLECSVNDSISSCQKNSSDLNNGTGAYNPYADTPLRYAPFGYSTGPVNYAAGNDVTCGDVKLRTTADAITAKWSQAAGHKAAGAKCTITYRVLDKNGRLGTGVLEFTFKGVPGAVRSVSQVAYSASSVTLQIVPPTSSYPAVDSFEVVQDNGQPFTCQLDEGASITRCVIRNLSPYDGVNKANLHKYSVRASNSEGVSNSSRIVEDAYAFRSPKALTENNIRAVTVYDPAATTSVGYAEVTIYPVADASVKSYSVSSDVVGSQVDVSITDTSSPKKIKVAAKPGLKSTIKVSATGDVKPPIGSVADAGSSASWVGRIAAVPKVAAVSAKNIKLGNGWVSKLSVSASNRNFSNKPSVAAFVLFTGTTKPTCNWDPSTNVINVTNASGGTSLVERGTYTNYQLQVEDLLSPEMSIEDNASYTPMVCYANGFGLASITGKSLSTLSDPADGQFQYAVNPNPVDGAWLVALTSSGSSSGVYAQFNGSKTDDNDWRNYIYSTYFGEDPVIKVRYCKIGTSVCSPGNRLVTPSDSTRSWQMKITHIDSLIDVATGTDTTACVRLKEIDFRLSGSGLTSNAGTQLWQASENSTYFTANGSGTFDKPGDFLRLPRSAVNVTKVAISFQGRDSNSSPHVSGLTGAVTLEFTCH